MKHFKVEILTDEEMWGKIENKILILSCEDLEHLRAEMQGQNKSIWEYETKDKKIISDEMIRRIIKVSEVKD